MNINKSRFDSKGKVRFLLKRTRNSHVRFFKIENQPFNFLPIFVEEPFSTATIPRDSHVMPPSVIDRYTNKQFLVIYVQLEGAIILDDKSVILQFPSYHISVGHWCPRVLCVMSSHPKGNCKSVHVWNVSNT